MHQFAVILLTLRVGSDRPISEHRAGYDEIVEAHTLLPEPTNPEMAYPYHRHLRAANFADWIFEPGKWVFPDGVADDYAFSQWLEERVTPAPEFSQVGTFNYAWRPVGTDAWRFWHGPDPKGRDTTDINSGKIRETRATIINQPFMLDGEKVQSVPMVDQLAVVTQAVNMYRDRPGSEWRPIEVLDADRVLTRLDTLSEAVDFCQQNINHSLALHAARVWVEAEIERKSAIREAQFADYETLTVDQAQVFQDTAETVDEEWRFYDIREAVKTRMAYNLEHAEVVHADPDKASTAGQGTGRKCRRRPPEVDCRCAGRTGFSYRRFLPKSTKRADRAGTGQARGTART